jgi:nucleoside permease NupC
VIEMGIIVGIALLVSLAKANWSWRMRVLSNPLLMDLIIFALLLLIHWGTFSGVMVATIGAFTCSVILSGGRKVFGYYEDGDYMRGMYDITDKLN